MKGEKIITDPVHGAVPVSGFLLELLGTPELMRLNSIHQLGLAYLVFPGAHHTRFEHSLGTSHIAGLLASALDLEERESDLVKAAGLLHDIGHGPYSHTLEKVFFEKLGKDHMNITQEMIAGGADPWDTGWWGNTLKRGMSVPEILEDHDLDPNEVASLVRSEADQKNDGTLDVQDGQAYFSRRTYLNQIIHSALDSDQLDYLLRDAHYTGVAHGIIDLDRILRTSLIHHGMMMVHRRGLSALEGVLVARSLMYSSVYFHKTARIAESMLCRAVDGLERDEMESIWQLSDGEVLPGLKRMGGLPGELATRLRFRRLYKLSYTIGSEAVGLEGEDNSIKEIIMKTSNRNGRREVEMEIERAANLDEGSVLLDVPDPSLLLSEPRLRRTDIMVLSDRVESLSSISSIARSLHRRPTIEYCLSVSCPKEEREKVKRVCRAYFSP